MKGAHAISPANGSSLSQNRHYINEQPRPLRVPKNDHTYGNPSYELTSGEAVSSKMALMNFVRRVHVKQHDEDDQLYQRAALALRRLKADDGETRDEWILFALAERLAQLGHSVDWLRSNVDPVCPQCGGKLKWEIVDALRSDAGTKTAREIAESVGCSKEHVRTTLKRLCDDEFGNPAVQAFEKAGDHGATVYADSGAPNAGVVDTTSQLTTNDHVLDSYTWSLVIRDPTVSTEHEETATTESGGGEWDWQSAASTGDPPSD
jgi:hypothetical protein